MATTTTPPASRASAPPIVPDEGPARVLQIPPPFGIREQVVREAVAALVEKYADDVDKAEETIQEFGVTIEVTRLRDRLARSAATDLQRLLLSTAGVPETLFNEAIETQLEGEEEAASFVKDQSVLSISNKIQQASSNLDASLSAINRSTQQFQESTKAIVDALGKVAEAIEDAEEYPSNGPGKVTTPLVDPEPSTAAAKPAASRKATRSQQKPDGAVPQPAPESGSSGEATS